MKDRLRRWPFVGLGLAAALLVAAPVGAFDQVLDQHFEGEGGATAYRPHSNASSVYRGPQALAQTFTAGLDGDLVLVELFMSRFRDTTEGFVVEIRAGGPTGTLLATSNVISPGAVLTHGSATVYSWSWIPITFSAPARMTAGQQYAIVLPPAEPTGSIDPWYYWLTHYWNDQYSGGEGWLLERPASWSQCPEICDALFRTYVSGQGSVPDAAMRQHDLARPATWLGIALVLVGGVEALRRRRWQVAS